MRILFAEHFKYDAFCQRLLAVVYIEILDLTLIHMTLTDPP